MSDFEIDLAKEVNRKAFQALHEVIDHVENGNITGEQGRWMLGVLQTAFSGVTDDNDLHQLLGETDELFAQQPQFRRVFSTHYRKGDDEYLMSLSVNKGKLVIMRNDTIIKQTQFELPSEAYKAMLRAHKTMLEKGCKQDE